MKKINDIEQLREILRNIIDIQDENEINNFNSLYDYSKISDMKDLWLEIKNQVSKNEKKVDWKNIKFPTLDMINVKIRSSIFRFSPLYEINLINTHNTKDFYRGFEGTKNLEKINLDLNSCKKREHLFFDSGIREVELLNTQNIKDFSYGFQKTEKLEKVNDLYLDSCKNIFSFLKKSKIEKINLYNTKNVNDRAYCFENSNIEEIELDMKSRENCESMFRNRKVKKINLKNRKQVANLFSFIKGNSEINYLKINLSNTSEMRNFIDEKNDIKYLEIIGIEEYLQKHIKKLKSHNKHYEKKIEELQKILKNGIQIERDFCDIFFTDDETKEYYQSHPIPYIKLVKLTKNTNYDIIIDSLQDFEVKKILKEKQKKENNKNKKRRRKKKK